MADDESSEHEVKRAGGEGVASKTRVIPNGGRLHLDIILDCLTSSRRRLILYYLQDHETATVEELARYLVAHEEHIPQDAVPAGHRDLVASQLVHVHLPKLADLFFIEYDPRSGTVRYTEPPALLDTVLGLLTKLEGDSGE